MEAVEPTAVEDTSPLGGTIYNHPAFGMIRASRVSGRSTLHGSDFIHNGYVTVAICRSSFRRNLASDWHHADDEVVSVKMSEAQWATFVSTLNCGMGVPCTIEHIERETMPDIPHRVATDSFKGESREYMAEAIETLRGIQKLNKKQQEAVDRAIMQLTSNVDFVADQFGKHIEKTVERAKSEIESYVTGAIVRAGIQVLSEGKKPLEMLPAAKE